MNRLILFFIALVFLVGCSGGKEAVDAEESSTLPPQYYYYPKANVYFDSANKTYFFQSGDSLHWQSAQQIPAVVLALMDKSILIDDGQDPVWTNNANHRLVYSAVLYATPNDTVAKKVVRSEKKPSASADSSAEADKKARKGIGGFFDKIFGRKKKKEQEQSDSDKRSG
jgi:hypothetical protein